MTGLVDPTKTNRKYANIKNFLDGPTLIQRTDAHEVEVVDEDRGKKQLLFFLKKKYKISFFS